MKLRALGVNLLVLVGSLVFLFAVLEVVARLFLPRPATVLVDKVEHQAVAPAAEKELRSRRGLPGSALFYDTPSGWRLQPNVRLIIRGHELSGQNVEVRTNSLGYRGDEVPPKTADDFRILVLGDSITLADYAPEDGTYPAHLERRLKELGEATKKLRVINSGTSSIDLRSEFMILMETGLSTKPDIVVEGLYLNDADVSFTLNAVTYPGYIRWSRFLTFLMSRTNYLKTALQVRARQADRKEEEKQFLAGHPMSDAGDWHLEDPAFNREVVKAFGDWGYAWTDDAWKKMGETLTLMKQVAADHDFELYVVLLPVRQQVEAKMLRDEPQQQFERVTRRLGLPHLDLLPILREYYQKTGADLYWDHCHMRPEGNELVGRRIADLLAQESARLHAIGIRSRGESDALRLPAPTSAPIAMPVLLNRPLGLAVASDGSLLVADEKENAIVRVSPEGEFAGRFGASDFRQPNAVAVAPDGSVYVADTWNQRVRHFSAAGQPLGDLPMPPGGFYAPRDVAVAPEGDVFVANTGMSRIARYDARGQFVTTWGTSGTENGQFKEALGVAAGGHEVYVADYVNARIQVFTYDGKFVRSWPVAGWKGAPIGNRPSILFHGDRVWVSDGVRNVVVGYSRKGETLQQVESSDIILEPSGIGFSRAGTLYVNSGGTGMVAAVDLSAQPPVARRFAPK